MHVCTHTCVYVYFSRKRTYVVSGKISEALRNEFETFSKLENVWKTYEKNSKTVWKEFEKDFKEFIDDCKEIRHEFETIERTIRERFDKIRREDYKCDCTELLMVRKSLRKFRMNSKEKYSKRIQYELEMNERKDSRRVLKDSCKIIRRFDMGRK